jgi:hypothetical protein
MNSATLRTASSSLSSPRLAAGKAFDRLPPRAANLSPEIIKRL